MCIETYKTKNGLNAVYVKDIIETRPLKYPSRHPDNLYVPSSNQITYGYKSYRIQGPKFWNLLPSNTKQAKTLQSFKIEMKKIEMPFCSCEKCLKLQTVLTVLHES